MSRVNPRRVRLDASTACQLCCPLCPNTTGTTAKIVGRGFLRFADFKSFVEQNPKIRQIELSNWGELFLNPELMEILKLSYSRGITLTAFNGSNLNNVSEGLAEALVKYKFCFLSCSIDGATPEIYERYRIGGSLKKVLTNLDIINYYKKQFKSFYPILQWQFIVFHHNYAEVAMARRMAAKFDMLFLTKINWKPEFRQVLTKTSEQIHDNPVKTIEDFSAIYHKPYYRRSCYQLWNEPQINWDGRVLGCCENTGFDFGANAFEDGFLKSVNSEKMVYARQMLMGQVSVRDDIPCAHCPKFVEMKAMGSYLTKMEVGLDRLRGIGLFFALFKKPLFHKAMDLTRNYGQPLLDRIVRYVDIPYQ